MRVIRWKRMPIANPTTGYYHAVHHVNAEVFKKHINPAKGTVSAAIKSINQLITKILNIET